MVLYRLVGCFRLFFILQKDLMGKGRERDFNVVRLVVSLCVWEVGTVRNLSGYIRTEREGSWKGDRDRWGVTRVM